MSVKAAPTRVGTSGIVQLPIDGCIFASTINIQRTRKRIESIRDSSSIRRPRNIKHFRITLIQPDLSLPLTRTPPTHNTREEDNEQNSISTPIANPHGHATTEPSSSHCPTAAQRKLRYKAAHNPKMTQERKNANSFLQSTLPPSAISGSCW